MAEPEQGSRHCTECGAVNPAGASYCQRCGAFLGGEAHDVDEPAPPPGETTIAYQLDEAGDLHPVDLERVAAEGGTLIIRSGGGRAGETFELQGDKTRVGRSPDADVFLDDVTVSRNHALLVRRRDGVYIDDLGSLNGTYITRRRIESHKLAHGDELQIGKYKLTFLER
jgi:hypothetical protein